MAAIHAHGPSPIHRKSFNPVRTLLQWTKPKATKPALEPKPGARTLLQWFKPGATLEATPAAALEAAPAAGADAPPNGKVAAQAAAPPKTASAAPTRAANKKPTAAAVRTTKRKAGGESAEPGAQATQPPKPRATNALRSGK